VHVFSGRSFFCERGMIDVTATNDRTKPTLGYQ